MWVTNFNNDTVSVIDITTIGVVDKHIPVGDAPFGLGYGARSLALHICM